MNGWKGGKKHRMIDLSAVSQGHPKPQRPKVRHKNRAVVEFHVRHKNRAVVEFQRQTNGEEDIQQNKKQLATALTTQGISIHIKIIYGRNINRQHVACNVSDIFPCPSITLHTYIANRIAQNFKSCMVLQSAWVTCTEEHNTSGHQEGGSLKSEESIRLALHSIRGGMQVMFSDNNNATASHEVRTHGPCWCTAHASSTEMRKILKYGEQLLFSRLPRVLARVAKVWSEMR